MAGLKAFERCPAGKTHSALEALRAARTGMYCGPLRLLALEVSERLREGGLPCRLVTGQVRAAALLLPRSSDQSKVHFYISGSWQAVPQAANVSQLSCYKCLLERPTYCGPRAA